MDEVLLRTRAVLNRRNEVLIETWRFLGILQRGSAKCPAQSFPGPGRPMGRLRSPESLRRRRSVASLS
jgi:hypothetical protein